MKFQEIDLTFEPINDGIPIEIEVIFKYSFEEGKLHYRFQKITGANYTSFAPYVDYWNFIESWKKDLVYGENGESLKDIIPYYEAYSKGFLDGYFEFENEIKEINQIFNQNSFPIEKIFSEIKSSSNPFSTRGYFYKNDDSKEEPIPVIKKELLYRDGLKIGRNYKAWFYIIKNPKPFISLFRDFYSHWFEIYENEFRKWNSHFPNYHSKLQSVINEIKFKEGLIETSVEPELQKRFIIDPTIIDKLFKDLSVHFEGFDKELKLVLEGQKIRQKLFFNSNGNKLTDVFYRLHENGQILNEKKITAQWICEYFENKNQKTGRSQYKYDVVYKQLTNKSGGIAKAKRICKDL